MEGRDLHVRRLAGTTQRLGVRVAQEKGESAFGLQFLGGRHDAHIDAGILCRPLRRQGGVRVREESDVLIFEVSDDGCGMDYDVKKRVFTTFFTTKGAEGTGLGLLTARKIAQEHGGKISVESSPGKGSSFRLELPRDRLPKLE